MIPLQTEFLRYVSFERIGIRLIEIPIIWPCFYISLFDGSEYFGSLLGFGLQDESLADGVGTEKKMESWTFLCQIF